MRIVINHLTRMSDHICVAGFDPDTSALVRPILPYGGVPYGLLARHGGPFDIANVVDLGEAVQRPQPPHVEDHLVDLLYVKKHGQMPPDEFWQSLKTMAAGTLRGIFGDGLQQVGPSCVMEAGKGRVSLGCVRPARPPSLHVRQRPDGKTHVRMALGDGAFDLDAAVTDIRLYQADHVTPRPEAVRRLAARLEDGETVILSVGLTRPYSSSPDTPPMHWVQVNNVHLERAPAWQLG